MKRDITIVLGKTGFGKSLFSKLMTKNSKRFLVFDPLGSYENVTWLRPSDLYELYDNNDGQLGKKFRLGIFEFEALETFGLMAFVTGDNILLIEEASQVFPKGCALPDWTNKLTFMGRHQSCSLLITAQRASSIPIDLRSQANRVVSFRQSEPNDLKWLSEFFDKQQQHQITQLKVGQCLDFQDNLVTNIDILPQVKKQLGIDIKR